MWTWAPFRVSSGGNIRWHTGEVTPFQRKGRPTVSGWQAYEGLNEACNVHICVWHKGRVLEAKLEGSSLIWPTETWLRKSSCEHIATKWPNPPPKPVQTMVKRASELRFASDSISDHFADGRPLMNLVHDIMLKAIDPYVHPNMILDCVRLPHSNALYCLNNRRLWCLNRLEEIQHQEVGDLGPKHEMFETHLKALLMESFPFSLATFFKEGRTLCEVNFCRSLEKANYNLMVFSTIIYLHSETWDPI